MGRKNRINIPKEEVLRLYKEGCSVNELAKKYNVYTNKIYRFLKKHLKVRDKSAAQSLVLKLGKKEHPTRGKKSSDETRLAISISQHEAWEKLSPAELKKRSDKATKNWYNQSREKQRDTTAKANAGSRIASKEGSRVEKFVKAFLEEEGYKVIVHGNIAGTTLEVDMYISSLRTIIEVNGPSHYNPIWGDEKLKQQQDADHRKYSALVSKGLHIIKIKYLVSKFGLYVKDKLKKELIVILNQIKNNENPLILLHEVEII